jgi:hypothetical protein
MRNLNIILTVVTILSAFAVFFFVILTITEICHYAEDIARARMLYGKTLNIKKAAFRLHHTKWSLIPECFDMADIVLLGPAQLFGQFIVPKFKLKEKSVANNMELLK